MALSHFRMLIHEFLKQGPDIFPEASPLIILDGKFAMCMDNNSKDTEHTRHISRRVHFVKNDENFKIHRIGWCEGGLKLVEIATKTVGETDSNPRMKYIMVRIDN